MGPDSVSRRVPVGRDDVVAHAPPHEDDERGERPPLQAYDRFCSPWSRRPRVRPLGRSRPPATRACVQRVPAVQRVVHLVEHAAMRTLAMTVVPSTSRSAYSELSLGSSSAFERHLPAGTAGYGSTSGDQPRTTASAASSPPDVQRGEQPQAVATVLALALDPPLVAGERARTVTERSARSSWNASPGCHRSARGTARPPAGRPARRPARRCRRRSASGHEDAEDQARHGEQGQRRDARPQPVARGRRGGRHVRTLVKQVNGATSAYSGKHTPFWPTYFFGSRVVRIQRGRAGRRRRHHRAAAPRR